MFVKKKGWTQKCFGPKKFLSKENVWSDKIFWFEKKILSKKIFGLKNLFWFKDLILIKETFRFFDSSFKS